MKCKNQKRTQNYTGIYKESILNVIKQDVLHTNITTQKRVKKMTEIYNYKMTPKELEIVRAALYDLKKKLAIDQQKYDFIGKYDLAEESKNKWLITMDLIDIIDKTPF
jgi:hypothetical protein